MNIALFLTMEEWKTYKEMTKGEQLMFRLYGYGSVKYRYNKQKKAVEYKI